MIAARPNRRTLLRGLGVSVALPFFESLSPASPPNTPSPMRIGFFYAPNGKHMADWSPETEGELLALGRTLLPLDKHRDRISVLSGLCLRNAASAADGPGDHARAMSAFLTGVRPKKTSGADVQNGVSIDQVLAPVLGRQTRFPSLEIGCEGGRVAGLCDNGYSCIYQTNLSWRSPSTPMPKEINPRLIFERLFGDRSDQQRDPVAAKRDRDRGSVLDFVAEDAQELKGKLGGADRQKLDEYLTGVRAVERRIQQLQPTANLGRNNLLAPTGVPENYCAHALIMADLTALAFQADLTRVATFVLGNDGSNRSYRELGITEGHHDLSHHGGEKSKQEKLRDINKMHIAVFAHFIERLKGIAEGSGTLLDCCTVVYGSGIRDGDRHDHDDLPILVAGGDNGTRKGGRHIRYAPGTPLCNLYMLLLERAGIKAERFGDSTGVLKGLAG